MVEQHVAAPQHQPRVGVGQDGRGQRAPGREAQLASAAVRQPLQTGKVDRRHPVDVLLVQDQPRGQQLGHGIAGRVDLQPYHSAAAPLHQHGGHRFDEVLVGGLVHLQIGVAGDPEQRVFGNPVAGEELLGVHDDRVLREQEAVLAPPPGGNWAQPVEGARDRHQRDLRVLVDLVRGKRRRRLPSGGDRFQAEREVQAQAGHGSGPVIGHANRRQGGEDLEAEVIGRGTALLIGQVGRGNQVHAGGVKLRRYPRVQCAVLARDDFVRRGRHLLQALAAAGGAAQLPLQRRYADHEELVEVGTHDGQEAHPLQQRHLLALRLVKHAAVELHPAQLAVEEGLFVCRRQLEVGAGHEPTLHPCRSRDDAGPLGLVRGQTRRAPLTQAPAAVVIANGGARRSWGGR